MNPGRHFRADSAPAPIEIDAMVAVLEGRHGIWAADVAEFFSTLHSLKGDTGRSWGWANVADRVRHLSEQRQQEHAHGE